MTNRSPNAVRRLVALRRLARRLRGVGLSAAWVAGVGPPGRWCRCEKPTRGAPHAAPAEGWLPARPVPEGRLVVAVVLGASGSVITDALGPYEVFARSQSSSCTRCRPAARPRCCRWAGRGTDYSLDDVDAGLAPEPGGRGSGRGCPKRQEGSTAARVDRSPGRPGSTPAGRVQRLPAAGGHGPA